MPIAYYVSVTLHLLAALLWLGGTFFLAVVGAPVLRRLEPPELRAELFRQLGLAFRRVGWIAVGVLVITGAANLYFRGVLTSAVLGSSAFWAGRYGRALAWKLGCVAGILILSALHDFVIGPAASRYPPSSIEALRYRRAAAWLARVGVVVGLVLVVAAARLARGG